MHSFMCSARDNLTISRSCFVLIMNTDTDLPRISQLTKMCSKTTLLAGQAKLLIYRRDVVVVGVVLINIFEEHE